MRTVNYRIMPVNTDFDIIIVGAGPAGLCASVYAARAGKSCCVFEKETFGGQIASSPLVENYPAVLSISGEDFTGKLLEQAKSLGVTVKFGKVKAVADHGNLKSVTVGKNEFTAKAVIFATGSRRRRLGAEREEEFIGAGVSYCAVCDGAFFAGKSVCVAGGGNTALQDAVYLANRCEKVYLIHRRTEFRAEKALQDKVKDKENIEIVTPADVVSLVGEKRLESVGVKLGDGSVREIAASGLFVAIGQEPQNELFGGLVSMTDDGYADVDESTCASNGIFTAGDCRRKTLRQLTTAVSDGSAAAVAACNYIDGM